ncbi:MAG TPA: VOC family protein [Bacteroidales bacterium]|nr:VOC family protein [Bacteroidales bacterium]
MVIDHICIAVNNLTESIEYWSNIFGYTQMTIPVLNTRQKVKVVFLKKDQSIMVKLIEPTDDNNSLKKFVEQGGGFHHICFKCDNLGTKISELNSLGVRMLVPPQPGEAFANNEIAFFWAKNRINFELIQTDEKAGIIDNIIDHK